MLEGKACCCVGETQHIEKDKTQIAQIEKTKNVAKSVQSVAFVIPLTFPQWRDNSGKLSLTT